MNAFLAYTPAAARFLLGGVFLIFGLNGFLHFLPTPPSEGAAAEFLTGLAAVGYFFPFLKLTEIAVGLALLSNRFVPLALTVLAPITINIVAFHSLNPQGLPMGLVIVALQLGLAWHYRESFKPLLTARFKAPRTVASTSTKSAIVRAA